MPDALRVAAMDCGTNSLRLLVTDVRGDEKREPMLRPLAVWWHNLIARKLDSAEDEIDA